MRSNNAPKEKFRVYTVADVKRYVDKRSRLLKVDVVVSVIVLAAFLTLAAAADLYETIAEQFPRAEHFELDEIMLAVAFSALVLMVFALRRWMFERRAVHRLACVAEALDWARREAEGADQAKSQFLATMSHELRTPLNAIIGFSDVIADEVVGPGVGEPYRDYARDIGGSARTLLQLIEDLLEIAQLESGERVLESAPVDLLAVLDDCSRLTTSELWDRQVDLDVMTSVERPAIVGDERAVRQILLNLLSNAVKYGGTDGKVVVGIDRNSDETLISVQDDGPGIPAHMHHRVFVPFFRLIDPRRQADQGTGIGLSLVKRLTELMAGRVWIDSAPGQGTTVHVALKTAAVVPTVRVEELRPARIA